MQNISDKTLNENISKKVQLQALETVVKLKSQTPSRRL